MRSLLQRKQRKLNLGPVADVPSSFSSEILGDAPRILGFVLFQKHPSVLLDDLPAFHRGFARRRGRDVQFFRYRDRAHP